MEGYHLRKCYSWLTASGVAKVCGALNEVEGLGPLASTFFSWRPLLGPISVEALSDSP